MKIVVQIFICSLLISAAHCLFSSKPDVTFATGYTDGTVVKISPFSDEVVIGFKNGYLKIYDMQGTWESSILAHTGSIVDIEWTNNGFISVDSNGLAIYRGSTRNQYNRWNLNDKVIDISVASTSSNTYVAFNFQTRAQEYYINGTLIKTYTPQKDFRFSVIQYGKGYNYLFTGLTSNWVNIYSCTNGSLLTSVFINGKISKLSLLDNKYQVLVMTKEPAQISRVLYFAGFGGSNFVGTYGISTKDMVYCPGIEYFILASSHPFIGVYSLYSGHYQQQLDYINGSAVSLDCSQNYLVSLDSVGNVQYNSYVSLPIWIIAAICVIVGVISFIAIVCFIRRKRRMRARKNGFDNYSQFNQNVPNYSLLSQNSDKNRD